MDIGYVDHIGGRFSMEDVIVIETIRDGVILYGVLDGHGGPNAALYMKELLPRLFKEADNILDPKTIQDIFLKADTQWYHDENHEEDYSGTTFSGILLTNDNIIVINLGDSRTVVFDKVSDIFFSIDHKASSLPEASACRDRGGFTFPHSYNPRVMYVTNPAPWKGGGLQITRALGDKDYKGEEYLGLNAVVSPKPDVNVVSRAEASYVVIGSDGIFDVVDHAKIIELFSLKGDMYTAKGLAEDILGWSMAGTDNKSVIVIKL